MVERGRAETKDTTCEKGMGWKKNHIRIKDAYVKPIKMGRRHRSRRRRRRTTVNRSHVEEIRRALKTFFFLRLFFFFRLEVVEHTTVSSKPVSGANDSDGDDGINTIKYSSMCILGAGQNDIIPTWSHFGG